MALPISKDYLLTQLRNFKSVILDPAYTIQKTSLPTASSANEGAIFQYIGSASGMTVGGFYQCQEVTPATDPKTYHWVEVTTKTAVDDDTIHADADGVLSIDSKFKKIYTGHKADWEALTTAEKVKYDEAHFDDDDEGTGVEAYSTTETKTNKVWIDGKPIYRKVVVLPSAVEIQNIGTSGTEICPYGDIDTLISGTCKGSADSVTQLVLFFRNTTNNTVSISKVNVGIALNVKAAILEYTKTTD